MKKIIILSGLILSFNGIKAQGFECHTHSMTEAVLNANPERKKAFEAAELRRVTADNIAANSANKSMSNSNVILTIPVVFHVMHEYGNENISKAQIEDAMLVLNRDFQKLNADTATVHVNFKPLIGNTEFEFKLATLDENGQCTDGIVRHVSSETNFGNTPATQAGLTWNPTKYLNIFTVKAIQSGAAGYTYIPGTWPQGSDNDAIIILSSYVGSIGTGSPGLSRALSHEVGHWFSLRHVWGGTNQPGVACGDDGVTDTPVTKGWTTCNVNGKSCPSDPAPVDNVENIMEYAYCQKMFSIGQANRMRNEVLTNVGAVGRNNLYSPANLIATGVNNTTSLCLPKAEFPDYTSSICANASITFLDKSWRGAATSYLWKLMGPVTYTSNLQNGVFTPTVQGVYDLRLIVTNATGSDSMTRTGVLKVKSDVAAYTYSSFAETFPSTFTFTNGWDFVDPDFDNGFANFTGAGVGDNTCLKLDAQFTVTGGSTDYLETPGIDLTNMPNNAKIVYYWAFAKSYSTMNGDKLALDISTNCGNTWSQKSLRSGATFKSTSTYYPNTNFLPTAAQWKRDSLVIGPLSGPSAPTNLKLRFRFTNDINNISNPFYIDKIGIIIPSGLEDIIKAIDLKIYPNPSNGKVNLAFNALSSSKLDVKVETLLGQTIFEKNYAVNFGTQTIDLSKDKVFAKGIYLVKFNIGDVIISKKMVIE
jgi:PKD repeat protein